MWLRIWKGDCRNIVTQPCLNSGYTDRLIRFTVVRLIGRPGRSCVASARHWQLLLQKFYTIICDLRPEARRMMAGSGMAGPDLERENDLVRMNTVRGTESTTTGVQRPHVACQISGRTWVPGWGQSPAISGAGALYMLVSQRHPFHNNPLTPPLPSPLQPHGKL